MYLTELKESDNHPGMLCVSAEKVDINIDLGITQTCAECAVISVVPAAMIHF